MTTKKQFWRAFDGLSPLEKQKIVECRQKWRIPNWEDPMDYPLKDSDLKDDEWKWEFLRRSEQYRTAYKSKLAKACFQFSMPRWLDPSSKNIPSFYRPGVVVEKYAYECGILPEEVATLAACSDPEALTFTVYFDISKDFIPQKIRFEDEYDSARKFFLTKEQRKKRLNRKNNPDNSKARRSRTYLLRALDAKSENFSLKTIATILDRGEAFSDNVRRDIIFAKTFWKRL